MAIPPPVPVRYYFTPEGAKRLLKKDFRLSTNNSIPRQTA